ncbi:UNKNOWN [Stylonychia lemnae]|uniref:Uncharacterized protein n=1 Tax=Stylonychia lemnae TaxID=5949 RepID=A0A077ZQ46_STYLE|nr:UNKNOWN [Stylonychia lemnae]|eukprot:CDW71505.1 UNKNOWN [Stylonychia lemnae]
MQEIDDYCQTQIKLENSINQNTGVAEEQQYNILDALKRSINFRKQNSEEYKENTIQKEGEKTQSQNSIYELSSCSDSDDSDSDEEISDDSDDLDPQQKQSMKDSLFGFQMRDKKSSKCQYDKGGESLDDNFPMPNNMDGGGNSSDDEGSENNSSKKFQRQILEDDLDDCPPDEMIVTGANGQLMKMITTVSGQIPLDFNNTKIIRDGKKLCY